MTSDQQRRDRRDQDPDDGGRGQDRPPTDRQLPAGPRDRQARPEVNR